MYVRFILMLIIVISVVILLYAKYCIYLVESSWSVIYLEIFTLKPFEQKY